MSKYLSKITIASLVASLMMVVGVSAVGNNVLTLEAEQDQTTGEITFSGTTDEGVVAISCILNDKNGEEVFFGSMEVNEAAFGGTFEIPVDEYTLMCANYDGGDWVSATIEKTATDEEPGEEAEDEETAESESPDTGRSTKEGASAIISRFAPLAAFVVVLLVVLAVGIVVSKQHKED